MSENNKAIVRRLIEEVWNKGNLSLVDELFAPNYEHHDASSPDFGRGPESEKKRATLYRTAFPDLRVTIEDIIAEGEIVMTRWSCRGTHKGDLSGIAPTGNPFTISGMTVDRTHSCAHPPLTVVRFVPSSDGVPAPTVGNHTSRPGLG